MLTDFSKLASGTFVLGFFLPTVIGIVATAVIYPNAPVLRELIAHIGSDKSLGDVTYVVLAVWTAAVLLLAVNFELYRLLEGDLPPASWLTGLRDKHVEEFKRLTAERDRLNDEWASPKYSADPSSFPELERLRDVKKRLFTEYPSKADDVRTTSFGNRIRAFEVYPRDVYGADGIDVQLRLSSVIPEAFQNIVDAARAKVDLLVNLFYISSALAVSTLISIILDVFKAFSPPFVHDPNLLRYGVAFILAAAASRFTYSVAVLRVSEWGDLVRTSFDCYLPALANQIGYTLPNTESERRAFWLEFSQQITYADLIDDGCWTLAAGKPASESESSGDRQLRLSRRRR